MGGPSIRRAARLGHRLQTRVQRRFKWVGGPKIKNKELAKNYLKFDFSNGYTPPVWNGDQIESAHAARMAILPPTVNLTAAGEAYDARVTDVRQQSFGYNMYLPASGPWFAWGPKNMVGAIMGIDQCQGASGNCLFEVRGDPDADALSNQVEAHEAHHAGDHMDAAFEVLHPWDEALRTLKENGTAYRRDTPEAAVAAVHEAAGGTPGEIADQLWNAWDAASRAFHDTEEGKTNIGADGADATCDRAWVTITVP